MALRAGGYAAAFAALDVVMWVYCLWQFWWLSAAWGAAAQANAGFDASMMGSIDARLSRLGVGLLILGAALAATLATAVWSWRARKKPLLGA